GVSGADYRLAGFGVSALSFSADIGPGSLDGSGSLTLVAPVPGGDQSLTIDISFDRDSITLDGEGHPASLDVGTSPALLALVNPFIHAHFTAGLPGGPLSGSVEAGADSATVLPATPVGTATGLDGTLDSTGALTLHADTVTPHIAQDAIAV